jgi:hypothetical protein
VLFKKKKEKKKKRRKKRKKKKGKVQNILFQVAAVFLQPALS